MQQSLGQEGVRNIRWPCVARDGVSRRIDGFRRSGTDEEVEIDIRAADEESLHFDSEQPALSFRCTFLRIYYKKKKSIEGKVEVRQKTTGQMLTYNLHHTRDSIHLARPVEGLRLDKKVSLHLKIMQNV